MLTIRVPGEIRGKGRPRFRRQGNFVRTHPDPKTASAEIWVRACAIDQVGQPCLAGPLTLAVAITVPIPPSWPKRKQKDALAGIVRPTGKPDADNTLKLLADALNKVVWQDDAQLVDVRVVKTYGAEPGAVLEVGTA